MDKKSTQQSYLVGTLILSVVGVILVLATDWGGYIHYDPYYGTSEYYIYLFTWVGFLPLFFLSAIFAFTAIISFLGLKTPEKLSDQFILYGLLGSIIIIITNVFGIIIFAISASDTEWWLETSFYASIIGGILNSVLFYLLRKG